VQFANWRHDQVLVPGKGRITPATTAHYQFFVIFPSVLPEPRLLDFEVVKVE
jgi:hypothetical protein